MTIFELVKLALDELYAEGKATYGAKLDAEIKAKMQYLSASYANLTDAKREPVDYKDPATRFAYVYKYVASHSDYVFQVLQQLRSATDKKSGNSPSEAPSRSACRASAVALEATSSRCSSTSTNTAKSRR